MSISPTDVARARRTNANVGPRRELPQVVFPGVGDNRIQVPNAAPFPYGSIGEITATFPAGSFGDPIAEGPVMCAGTAAVCDPTGHYLLTAAHNFIALDNAGISPTIRRATSAVFQPAGGGAAIRIAGWRVLYEEYESSVIPYGGALPYADVTSFCYDLAIAVLEEPVETGMFGRNGMLPQQLDWSRAWPAVPAGGPAVPLPAGPPWSPQVTGYPGDKPDGTMWTAGGNAAGGPPSITLDPGGNGLLFYTIATNSGESGGPVWGSVPGSPAPIQIGVHLGVATNGVGTPLTNVAIWLSPARNDAIRNTIAELR